MGLACGKSVSLRERRHCGFTNSNSGAPRCARRAGGGCGGTVRARFGAGRAEDQQNEFNGVFAASSDGSRSAVSARAIAGGESGDGVERIVRQTGGQGARRGAGEATGGGEGAADKSQTERAAEGDFGGGKATPRGDQGGTAQVVGLNVTDGITSAGIRPFRGRGRIGRRAARCVPRLRGPRFRWACACNAGVC